jgi:HemY protein
VEDAHELLLGAIGELSESGSVFDEQTAREFREFIELYGMLPMQSGGAQLDNLERWLEAEPENSTLLRAAGRTCVRQRLWGKARAYLRASVSFEPTPATYFELGHLEADLGDAGASHAWFAQGANVHSKQDVPWLRAGTRC